ncbi:unnamed protein product, partial [Iphiclides podalirius]
MSTLSATNKYASIKYMKPLYEKHCITTRTPSPPGAAQSPPLRFERSAQQMSPPVHGIKHTSQIRSLIDHRVHGTALYY